MQELIKVDKKEAQEVLNEVDSLLKSVETAIESAGHSWMEVSFLILKVKRGAYWTERGFRSEQEYIDKVFPQSRSQYYAYVRFATNLHGYDREQLYKWGRSKCEDLVRLHLHFNGTVPAEWINHLNVDNKDILRRRVRQFLDQKSITDTAERTERGDEVVEDTFITFKVLGNGIHTVNLALDTMAKIMGSDKSVGHRIENICANFNSQFADDGSGHVMSKNAYIRNTVEGLVRQYNLKEKDASELLIGIIAKALEQNVAT